MFVLVSVEDSVCYWGWMGQLVLMKVQQNVVRTSLNRIISVLVNSEWQMGRAEITNFNQFKSYQGNKPRNVSCTLKCSPGVYRS